MRAIHAAGTRGLRDVGPGDREQAIAILGQVLGRATAAWRGAAKIQSTRPADATARWALDSLVELQRAAGRPRAAVDLLVEGARLPFDDVHKRELRLESAKKSTDIAGSTYLDQERRLMFNLRNAFVQTLQAKAVLENATENLNYWDRELAVNRTRFKAGDLAQVDLGRLDKGAQDPDRPQGPGAVPPPASGFDRPRVGSGTRGAAAADRSG